MTTSRRTFIQTIVAGAGTLATAENAFAPPPGARNMYAALNKNDAGKYYAYIGQDGQPINMEALYAKLKNQYTTLSFGFGECKEYCPMINQALSLAGKDESGGTRSNLTSVIVCANPEVDGRTEESRKAFMQKLREAGIRHNVVVLYPTENGKLSNQVVPEIAVNTGAIVNKNKPLDHSAKITLCGPGGHVIAEKIGLRPAEFREWQAHSPKGQEKK